MLTTGTSEGRTEVNTKLDQCSRIGCRLLMTVREVIFSQTATIGVSVVLL